MKNETGISPDLTQDYGLSGFRTVPPGWVQNSMRPVIICLHWTVYSLSIVLFPVVIAGQDKPEVDQIWVRNDEGSSKPVSRFPGTILDFNSQRLQINIGESDSVRTFSADKIEKIEARLTGDHLSALKSIEQAEWSAAFESLGSALRAESRPWVQREILALQIRILTRSGQLQTAAKLFGQILQSDDQTRFYYQIPLVWQTRNLDAAESELADQLMQSNNESLTLIGSSWLLSGPKRADATLKLEELSTNIDARISHLASAQLWRVQWMTATSADIERWQAQIERMPRDLQFGPRLIAGLANARRAVADNLIDETAIQLMRLPILYPEHHQECAAALLATAQLLETSKRTDEARQIYLELLNEYRDTISAETALQSPLVRELLKDN